jgi:site-specific recombinase XerD
MADKETPKQSESILSEFISHLRSKKMSDRTINAYASDVSGFLHRSVKGASPDIASIVAFQTKDLEEYLERLARSGLTFPSVRRASCALKSFFLFLLDQGMIQSDPAASLTVRQIKSAPHSSDQIVSVFRYLTRRQLTGEEADIIRYQRDELILFLMLFYGVPQCKLCTLRLSAIQSSRKSVSLVLSTGSTVQLHLSLLRKLRDYLERRKSPSEYVFLDSFSDKPIHRMTIRHILNELNCALKLTCTPLSLHDTYSYLQQHQEVRESLIRQILTGGSTHNYALSANA